MAKKFTHDELCRLACKWLERSRSQNGHGCSISISEVNVFSGEIPDAIGFLQFPDYKTGVQSILVEVKTSRSDFRADAKKPHRSTGALCMGDLRYYMVPEGLVTPDEIPEGWGLLYVTSRGFIKPIVGPAFELKAGTPKSFIRSCLDMKNPNVDRDSEYQVIFVACKRLTGFVHGGVDGRNRSWRKVFKEITDLKRRTSALVRKLKKENKRLQDKIDRLQSKLKK